MNPQLESVIVEMEKAVRGKRPVIEHILSALLAEGHILLDDMPGVGKTTLAVALSRAVDLTCRRVQFTPDVLPSDIVGFSMYDASSGQFLYRPGAATHANLLLADEINRTSSKTQSALLEAMEERQITVDGETHSYRQGWLAPTMNGRFYGGGMMPTPNQDRLGFNRSLSVMVFFGSSKLKTLAIFPSIFKGEHINHRHNIKVLCGHEITVRFDRPTPLQIDGETILGVTEYTVRAAADAASADIEATE